MLRFRGRSVRLSGLFLRVPASGFAPGVTLHPTLPRASVKFRQHGGLCTVFENWRNSTYSSPCPLDKCLMCDSITEV